MERIFIHGWKISKTDISYTGKCYYFFHLSTSFVNEARVLLACLKKWQPHWRCGTNSSHCIRDLFHNIYYLLEEGIVSVMKATTRIEPTSLSGIR